MWWTCFRSVMRACVCIYMLCAYLYSYVCVCVWTQVRMSWKMNCVYRSVMSLWTIADRCTRYLYYIDSTHWRCIPNPPLGLDCSPMDFLIRTWLLSILFYPVPISLPLSALPYVCTLTLFSVSLCNYKMDSFRIFCNKMLNAVNMNDVHTWPSPPHRCPLHWRIFTYSIRYARGPWQKRTLGLVLKNRSQEPPESVILEFN